MGIESHSVQVKPVIQKLSRTYCLIRVQGEPKRICGSTPGHDQGEVGMCIIPRKAYIKRGLIAGSVVGNGQDHFQTVEPVPLAVGQVQLQMACRGGSAGDRRQEQAPEKHFFDLMDFEDRVSHFSCDCFSSVCFLVFYPLFLRGLYFDKQMAGNFILTAVLAAMLIAIKAKKRDYSLLSTSLDIAIFLYVIAYLLSMFKAIHIGDAAWGFLKALDYFLIYILVGEAAADIKAARTILKTLLAAGVGVAVIGLLAATGYSNYPGAFVNNHIMSTLQYHNTMAAFLGAICFIGLALLLTTANIYRRLIYSGAVFLMALVTITAISKGALLIIVMAAGIFFLILSGRFRWLYLFDFIYLYVLAFLFSGLFMQQITGGQGPGGIIVVAAGTILAMAGQWLKEQLSLRIRGRSLKKAALIILIVLVVGGGLMMAAPGGQNLISRN